MSHRLLRFTLLGVMSLALVPMQPSSADAGPILDWLFGRRDKRVAAEAVAAAKPAVTEPTAGCCGPATCVQTVVRYAPQTAYRTVWSPVPVTTYKTTTSCNPETGLPMTCTRPCMTYKYQARRVPYTTYRPYYAQEVVNPTAGGSCDSCNTGVATTSYSPWNSTPYTSAAVAGYTPGNGALGSCGNGCSNPYGYGYTDPGYADVSPSDRNRQTPGADEGWSNIDPRDEVGPIPGDLDNSLDPADIPPRIDREELRRRIDPLDPGSTTRIDDFEESTLRNRSIMAPAREKSTSADRFRSNLRLIPNPRRQRSAPRRPNNAPELLDDSSRTAGIDRLRLPHQRRSKITVPIRWASKTGSNAPLIDVSDESSIDQRSTRSSDDVVTRAMVARPAAKARARSLRTSERNHDSSRFQSRPATSDDIWDDGGWKAHRPK